MANFVYDNGSVPGTKQDARPPRGPAAQELTAAEINQITTAVKDLRTAVNELPPYFFNVKRYGAKGDGVANGGGTSTGTDDQPAIQAAIDAAAAAGGGTVYLPRGRYIIGAPLRIRAKGIRLVGEGRTNTFITKKTDTAGWGLVIAPEPTAFPTTAALATGAGSAWLHSGPATASTSWLNLTADSDGLVTLDGRTSFTIEFYYRPTGPIAEIRNLYSAALKQSTNTATVEACSLMVNADGSMTCKTLIAGVVKTITTAAGVIVADVTKHIAVTYDNAKIRLFVGGVNVGEVAATGAVTQPKKCEIIFGAYTYTLLDNAGVFHGPKGAIDSIRFLVTPRYTSNFTPPTAKFSFDGETFCLINFDDIQGMFVGGRAGIVGGRATKFLFYSASDAVTFGSGSGEFTEVSDLYFESCGIYARCSVHLYFHDLDFTFARYAIVLQNNCFLSVMERLRAVGAGHVNFVNTSASGVNVWRSITSSSAENAMWFWNSGAYLEHLFLYACTEIPLVLLGGLGGPMSAIVKYANISDEAAAGMDACVFVDNLVSGLFAGCSLELITNIVPIVKVDDANADPNPLVFDTCVFNTLAGAAERFEMLGTRKNPIQIRDWAQWLGDATVPFCSDPGVLAIETGGSSTVVKGISGTDTAAKNLRGTLTISDGDTTGTVTFPTAEPDASYHVAYAPAGKTGSPAAGSNRWESVSKLAGSFTVTLEAAPGAGTSRTFDWILVR